MLQTTTYRFNKEDIKPHDVFFAEHFDFNGVKVGHYFYCIHAQCQDESNELFRDIVGLLITTKNLPGYVYPINLNGKQSFVCCDREQRFISEMGKVSNKFFKVAEKEKKAIISVYKKYKKEIMRQLKRGVSAK